MKQLAFALFLCIPTSLFAQLRCEETVNTTSVIVDPVPQDNQEHNSGNHGNPAQFAGSCLYQSVGAQYCQTNCKDAAFGLPQEIGSLGTIFSHFTGPGARQGGTSTAFGNVTGSCGAVNAVAVRSCLFSCAVEFTVSASGSNSGTGLGLQVKFLASNLWSDQRNDTVFCPAIPDVTFAAPGGGCDLPPGHGKKFSDPNGDPPPCGGNPCDNGGCSPIIIDTDGHGFALTPAANGVTFDISGTGKPIQIGWTAPGSLNAFLVLPQADGLVHSGKDLFGNFTTQDKSTHANGFLALAEWDEPDQGGNGDGVIDEHDAVFSRLRLWIDENHDGVSQSSELHTLSEMGIHSLSVSYFQSEKTDSFGNQFRYKARVNPRKEHRDSRDETPSGEPGRWAYDVFFVTK